MWRQQHAQMKTDEFNLLLKSCSWLTKICYERKCLYFVIWSQNEVVYYSKARERSPTDGGDDNVEGSPLSTHCQIPLRIAGTRGKCNKE